MRQKNKAWISYEPKQNFFDELIDSDSKPRKISKGLWSHLTALGKKEILWHEQASVTAIRNMGVSFRVYDEGSALDRSWPLDIIPRLISQTEWKRIELGLKQRLGALNQFIDDLYHKQKVLKDKIVPAQLILKSPHYQKYCRGVRPPGGIWAHICGTDLVKGSDGQFYVLEDNLRIPSGVSYVLENRFVMKKTFPELFRQLNVRAVDDYPNELLKMLRSLSPRRVAKPQVVVLTPGIYNSAYFEHSYLAHEMGVELVEGQDLFVDQDHKVFMKTIHGPKRVDVVYRRVDDEFLDPKVFRKDSVLGVPGIMKAWKSGQVALVNAPGAGVADDKVIYSYVPDLIRYYLSEEPILPNVPTWVCMRKKDRDYVIENIHRLVVKPANASGGYGIMIGPKATKKARTDYIEKIKKHPRDFVAQPVVQLSTAPTLINGKLEARHLDLRPFTLVGDRTTYVLPGGLTRVALRRGSLLVNSSQGGGSKDTWVVRD